MRLRPIAALSAAAVSVLLLAGCSGSGEDGAAPSPSATVAADLCSAQVSSGDASDAVTVTGDAGAVPEATFSSPVNVPELQVTVVSPGEGDAITAGDFINYAMVAYDAQTGEKLGELGFQPAELAPLQISPNSPLAQIIGCGAPGQRVVAAFPASEQGNAQIYVVDLVDKVPTAAWGEPQDPIAGMPVVTLGDNGAPTITIPETDPPTETQLATLKQGDGYTVQSGDNVLLQYTGVRWSNGETFDSTWDKGGVPTSFATTNVVKGFGQALEGHAVGSQVLVVVTPADGYGEGEINDADLTGDTLVFVVDILGAQHPATQ